jgi:type II secretory pathway component PulM
MAMYWMRHATDLLILLSGGLLTTTIGFAALWVRARERATRAESLLEGMRMSGRGDSLSPALDAIAEEVERIGEGQRFITRIMSESANRGEPARPRTSGSITPH